MTSAAEFRAGRCSQCGRAIHVPAWDRGPSWLCLACDPAGGLSSSSSADESLGAIARELAHWTWAAFDLAADALAGGAWLLRRAGWGYYTIARPGAPMPPQRARATSTEADPPVTFADGRFSVRASVFEGVCAPCQYGDHAGCARERFRYRNGLPCRCFEEHERAPSSGGRPS